jgi:hypothetical protein
MQMDVSDYMYLPMDWEEVMAAKPRKQSSEDWRDLFLGLSR